MTENNLDIQKEYTFYDGKYTLFCGKIDINLSFGCPRLK